MRIIANYLGINLLKGIFLVAILLLGIDLFFYFINELRFVGTGDYNLLAAVQFIILTIPRKLYIMSPWAALIGSLLVFGSMAKNCELVAMRTAGISPNKIALLSGYYVLLFTVLVFLSGELFAPKIELFAQKRKTLALSRGKAIYTNYGTWIRNGNKFIHVGNIKDHNTLQNITIYELDQSLKLKQASFAKSAELIKIDGSTDSVWDLKNVIITDFGSRIKKGSGGVKLSKMLNKQEQNLLDLNILQTANIKHLERLSIKHLATIIQDRLANNLTVIDHKVAFWKKIIQPFSILVMSYLAVPFVLGPLRSCSRGLRLVVGVVLGFIFYLLNALFCPLVSVANFPPSIAIMLPPMIFLALALYLAVRT